MKSGHCAVKDEACRFMQTPCGRRVPASSGPNLPGARTGAAATPRSQLSCAAQGCPCLRCLPARGLAAVLRGRRLHRRWHRRRSKLLSETLMSASLPYLLPLLGRIGSIVRPACQTRPFGRSHICLSPLHRWPQAAVAGQQGHVAPNAGHPGRHWAPSLYCTPQAVVRYRLCRASVIALRGPTPGCSAMGACETLQQYMCVAVMQLAQGGRSCPWT